MPPLMAMIAEVKQQNCYDSDLCTLHLPPSSPPPFVEDFIRTKHNIYQEFTKNVDNYVREYTS